MAQEIADSKLLDTWGSGGTKIEPDITKIIEGWQLGEQPPHEYMNWLQNTFGSKLNHILKNGIAKWNNETEYLVGATIQHNSSVWICKTTNTNSEPTELNNNWCKIPSLENLALTVDTINDFPTGATTGDVVIVKDLDRGGIFIYDSTKVAEDNQGTNFNGWVRQYSGAVNVKWFGAKGDNTNNDTPSFNLCLAFCRASNVSMYIPDGNYVLLSATTIGTAVSIIGQSESSTILKPNFSIAGYVFEFNSTNVVSKNIGDFSIIGDTQYGTITKGIKADPAYVMRFYNLTIHNVTNALYLNDSWGTSLKNIRVMYSIDPITMNIPNGSSIKDVYIQRFQGTGIKLVSGLSTSADNIILEYGVNTATGMTLQAMQNFKLSNFYTEGDMGVDILLTFKNQRACVNTKIDSCWFNSQATKIINAVSYRGLEIDNVVMQTPNAISLIDFTGRTYSDGSVVVGNVVQVDQNANSFLSDVRGTGQTLIPLSTNNLYVYLKTPHPSHGDYTNADLSNIANYTVKDSGGFYPCYDKNIMLQNDISSFNASYTGYFVYRTMKIASVYSLEPTTINFRFSAIATETVGDCTYNIKLTNSTNGYVYETSFDVAGKTTGQLIQASARLVLEKGANNVTFQIQRKTNDGGTTTLSASAYQFEKIN